MRLESIVSFLFNRTFCFCKARAVANESFARGTQENNTIIALRLADWDLGDLQRKQDK
jgi:hypothetical protein